MMQKNDFKPLDSECRSLLNAFLPPGMTGSCERSWANLMLYDDTYSWQWCCSGDHLWIASFEADYIFFPPDGNCTPLELHRVLSWFERCCDAKVVCGDLPWDYAGRNGDADALLELIDDPGDYDYIYDLEQQQSFAGGKLRKRHNQVRQFEREYASCYSVKVITSDDLPELMQLSERLSAAYYQTPSGMEEHLALERLVRYWTDESLQLGGVALKVADQMVGFSIFSPLDKATADIHFEKADRDFCGCGAKLTASLTEHLLDRDFKYMNREQDLNLEGLRRAKQALDPVKLWKRLSATLI